MEALAVNHFRVCAEHMHLILTVFTAVSHGKEMNGCSSTFSKTAETKFLLVVIVCLHACIVYRQINFSLVQWVATS